MRNADMHMNKADSERLVLQALASDHGDGRQVALPLSALGYAAYPGYRFKAPQGAALAVSRLLRSMQDRGLVARNSGGHCGAIRGYQIRPEGRRVLRQMQELAALPAP